MHRHMHPAFKGFAAAVVALFLLGGTAHAQSDKDVASRLAKVEQDLQRLQKQLPAGAKGAAGADATLQDSNSDLTVRILALERVVEQLTGQVEEAKFNSDRTARQVKILEDDLSLRVAKIEQSLGLTGGTVAPQQQGQLVPAPASATPPVTAPTPTVASTPAPDSLPPELRTPTGGGAMSQPVMSQPTARAIQPPAQTAAATPAPIQTPAAAATAGAVAAGGGFVIRTDAQGRPLPPDPNAPQVPPPAAPEPSAQQAAPKAAPAPGPVTSTQVASVPGATVALPDGSPKQQYDFAFDFLKRQDYPKAESALRDFLKKHPKDPLAGNAQYWLGETYYVRGDFQQAAVEFMAGYQNYPKTNKGPDNLLKLGMSMSKLNQSQGACTALSRIAKDYPDATAEVLASAKTERAKLKCK